MTLDQFFALLPIIATIVLTGWNLWFQQRQEKARAERSAQERLAEREANRTDRLHEHWLDTKIAIYRQFLARTSEAQALIHEQFRPGSGAPLPVGAIRAAGEALEELTLVASSEVSQAASEYIWAATWNVDTIRSSLERARAQGDADQVAVLQAKGAENDEKMARERKRFRALVRSELGLDLFVPSRESEWLQTPTD